ncbi:MAG: hypothetical protein ACLTWE_07935 [Dysgonomonas mossii]|uniref:hypothetical protein n=1 Tax=Dysgonomonas mossii TaxID=163665 RepID=UPI003991645F
MQLLTDLYKISSPSRKEKDMIRFISQRLDAMSIPYEVDKYGNIYAIKGRADTYPCIVAHTDEVHPKRSKGYEIVNFRDEIIFGYDTHKKHLVGIGADDKNGIWICLKCLEEYEYMKCAFFMAEEIGCIGSNRANMAFLDDCRYVLQCDRKGNDDFITSISGMDLCSKDFVEDINLSAHGYKINHGLQTDVAVLKQRGLDVSCVNISCGYYNPHMNEEYTKIADLMKCHQFVKHIVETCTDQYVHHYQPYRNLLSRYNMYYPHGFGHSFDFEDDETTLFPRHGERKSKSMQNKRYGSLLNVISNRLAFDSSLTIDDLMDIFNERFPESNRQEYETAYREVMG